MTRTPPRPPRSPRVHRVPRPPRVLSIAGSDSGGGAGVQADLKTFCAHGVYGMTVITAVTAQNTREVTAVHPIPAEVVSAQIEAVLSDIGADAIKIGMLANSSTVRVVARCLAAYLGRGSRIPIVLDPVMVAKSGDSLLTEAAIGVLVRELLPLATVVTPNLPEAELLAGASATTSQERLELARGLARRGPACLLKGGHAESSAGEPTPEVEDILCDASTERVFVHQRLDTPSTHGTGCTLSSAVAARLSRGDSVQEAVAGAIDYLQGALGAAYPLGEPGSGGHGPVNHLHLQGAGSV